LKYLAERLEQRGCDGFNIMFPWLPGGLDAFVDRPAGARVAKSWSAAA
jgi:hypothetical protein